jgi:hypothetical protein
MREAGNLGGMLSTLGHVSRSVDASREAVDMANRSGDIYARMITRTVLANCLHQVGELLESLTIFREAEALQAERDPDRPLLFTLQGYQYCELLIDLIGMGVGALDELATFQGVIQRARFAMGYSTTAEREPLFWGFTHLALARGYMGLATVTQESLEIQQEFATTMGYLNMAVGDLRSAGFDEFVARGLVVRATFMRLQGNFSGSRKDLDEAYEIAVRGSMRLITCDACIEFVRLHMDERSDEAARKALAEAQVLVREAGYLRRERELENLARELEVSCASPP